MNKISVIVPIFNSEKYLKKCLDSIVAQTHKDLEIILINDGSTDSSLIICEEYKKKDSRIIILNIKNGGTAYARNKGLDVATGDFIYFIDSDDFIERDLFEYLLGLLIKNNADISFCPYLYVNEKYEFLEKKNELENEECAVFNNYESMNAFLEWNIPCCICDKLFKKNLFDGVRFSEGYLCEDLNIVYILLSKSNKIVRSNVQKYFYVNRSGSQMRSGEGFKKLVNSIILVIKNMIDFYEKKYPSLYNKALCYGLDEFFIYFISAPNKKDFRVFRSELKMIIRKYIEKLPNDFKCLKKIKFKIFLFNINPFLLYFLGRKIRFIKRFFPIKH